MRPAVTQLKSLCEALQNSKLYATMWRGRLQVSFIGYRDYLSLIGYLDWLSFIGYLRLWRRSYSDLGNR